MYKVDKKLGQGAFGIVYHLQISNGDEFALKVSEVGRVKDHEIDSATEAKLMLKLTHVHLVQCCASFSHGRFLYLVMELCPHGTLKHFLSTRTKLVQEARVITWLGQMADALRYLHVCRVIHRDLKTDNVFLDDNRNVKIGDLGIAREMDYTAQRAGTFIGTFCYMSPEVLESCTYSYETDIWSLGCCIHEVMTLRQTFAAQSMMEVMEKIMEANIPQMPDIYNKKLKNLVCRMLDRKAQRRPDGLEILYTVSQIQGFPFESGPYTPLENIEINQKLLCEAVREFEHKFSWLEDTTSHEDKSTTQSAREEETENAKELKTDGDVIYNNVPKQHLKSKQQPRPLPPCRYMNKDVPFIPEKKLNKKHKIYKKLNNFHKSKQSSEQNNEAEPKNQVKHYPVLSLQDPRPSNPPPANGTRFASNTWSSLTEDSSSSINTTANQELTVQTTESVTCSDADDAGVSISRYMDKLATESRKWLRLKFGLPEEDRNLDGQVISNEAESENLVTLYTRAQVARYSNRKGKLEKDLVT